MDIFVGNLSFDATEGDVKKLFEGFGNVASVRVVMREKRTKSRGFGFVQMPDGQVALAAIAALNGTEFMGRPLKVSPARPRPEVEKVEVQEYPGEDRDRKDVWHRPVFNKRRNSYKTGRRSQSFVRRRAASGIAQEAAPRRESRNNPMRWRKKYEQPKPWQKSQGEPGPRKKTDGEYKPWRKSTGESKPWKSAGESKPWRKGPGESKPWKSAGEFKPWRKSTGESKPWKKSAGELKPWKKSAGESKPWRKGPGESKPWKSPGEFKPWKKSAGESKPWKKSAGEFKPRRRKSKRPRPRQSQVESRRKPGGYTR